MAPIRILVTGAGSGVGQGIVKALRISNLNLCIVGADIQPLNVALFRTDEAVLIPKVEADGALEKMITVIKNNKINIVMIGSEFDLEFFSSNKIEIEDKTNALIIASPISTVSISNDKWLTAEFLRENGLPFPKSKLIQNVDEAINAAQEIGFPCILKTRSGTSSRHVHVIKNVEEIREVFQSVPMPMIQEMIAKPSNDLGNEYTCSVFKTKDGRVLGPFTARRTLRGGSSWVIEVGHFKTIYPLLNEIGKKLPSLGSINVQLMVGPLGPIPFEFNARFSGTTAIRAHFGFNEPEMAIKNYFLNEELSQPQIRTGLSFRYLEEVFVEGISANQVMAGSIPKGTVTPWF